MDQSEVSNKVDSGSATGKQGVGAATSSSETNRRSSSRYQGKRKSDVSSGPEKASVAGGTGQKITVAGKSQKLELTEAEKELFGKANEHLKLLIGQDSINSSQGSPTNSNVIGRRKVRGDDSLIEAGASRTRRPKNNFSSDFVYDYTIRGGQNPKSSKEASLTNGASIPKATPGKAKKGGKKGKAKGQAAPPPPPPV
mmetsp:Transcript_45622/g.33355  ORF Transcript_45622/g.33355 Transcript_45622/m.33355 type:complete len:197 (-) Transcript_45622:1014-1604(-)